MAETKSKPSIEKEYTIPLRAEWRKVANYRRTGRAVKEIKRFIAKHMKVPDRDLTKVKLDMYLNQEIWFRGRKKPPAKIKVKAVKEDDIVKVTLVDMYEKHKFAKAKHEKRHKPAAEDAKAPAKEEKPKEEKTEEEKKEEKEKSQSVAEVKAKEAKIDTKAQQKATKVKETPIHRMALKK